MILKYIQTGILQEQYQEFPSPSHADSPFVNTLFHLLHSFLSVCVYIPIIIILFLRYLRTSYRCDPPHTQILQCVTSQVKATLLHNSHKSSKPGDDVAMTGPSNSHISLRICKTSQRCFFFFSGSRPVQKHMFLLAVMCLHFLSI